MNISDGIPILTRASDKPCFLHMVSISYFPNIANTITMKVGQKYTTCIQMGGWGAAAAAAAAGANAVFHIWYNTVTSLMLYIILYLI